MEDKKLLRGKFKEVRKKLDMQGISLLLCKKLRECEYYKSAKNVLIFYPLKYEVNTLELLNEDKNFYLPRVNGEDLEICSFKSGDELRISDLKIKEPVGEPILPEKIDLAIIPALAIDADNKRLGYGGGFYDRFLNKHKNIKSVVLIPKELTVKKLPDEPWDCKVDFVVTI